MNWIISVPKNAEKQIRRFPKKEVARIREAIDKMEVDPYFGDIQKMSGYENRWRRRVGSYRIKYEIDIYKGLVAIVEIKRRTSSTY
ncbi:MAG: type II toxin-antitoxin system RelE/ParE family toxin [Patescibacteria group bacterium]